MASFEYKASDKKGKIIQDHLTASSENEVSALLKRKNLAPIFIKKIAPSSSIPLLSKKISLPPLEKVNFCRYMATIIKAGLPLLEAVELITQETTDKNMKRILNDIRYQLEAGKTLSSAFTRYPTIFDEVFLAIVKAGEQSGTLEQSFEYLSSQLYDDYEMRQKIKGMLYYPLVITATMLGIGCLMLTVVLPRIAEVFLRMNINLPFYTLFLFKFSLFLQSHLYLFFGSLLFAIFSLFLLYKNQQGRRLFFKLFSLLPVFSHFLEQIDLARFNRLLSTLLNSGVPITDSIRIATGSLSQPQYAQLALVFEKELTQGVPLSKIFKEVKSGFPPIMTRLVAVGEKTGNLEKLLLDLAIFYEHEIDLGLKNFLNLLEPILMLIIGLAVGAMVVSIIAPIYSILGNLQV